MNKIYFFLTKKYFFLIYLIFTFKLYNMKELYFNNTLTRKIDKFDPINNDKITMYCCGPTVYNYAHIGNLRTYIFEDILEKTIKLAGYNVKHVMNITDVGHLTSDADDGEDKMLVAAEKEKQSVFEIARKYENKFLENMDDLNLSRPNIIARASEHIKEMIDFVSKLEKLGYAYKAKNGNIYFDTSKFKDYGKLSGQNREDLKHGARVDKDENKKNPSDFVLWFVSSKFKNQILQWESPWGIGYPGWHIECSTMAMKYLGNKIDIHCGGIDHIAVHHENEKAQSEAYLGHKWVNNWLHSEFLQIKNGKMSKSSGNFITLDTLKEKGYKPVHYKYFTLTAHYKTPLIFSYENLDSAKNAYENLLNKIKTWKKNINNNQENKEYEQLLAEYINKFDNFLFDDLKTPQALSIIWEVAKSNLPDKYKLQFIEHTEKVFTLFLNDIEDVNNNTISQDIIMIADQRKEAKQNKDWQKADELRQKILDFGYNIKDKPNNEYELIKK